MTRCTCTSFDRSGKSHKSDCPKWKAYVAKQQTSIPSEQRKAGKKERIKAMMERMRPDQQPVVDEQLKMALGVEEKCRIGPLRKMSASGRARCSAAARAYWANSKQKQEDTK